MMLRFGGANIIPYVTLKTLYDKLVVFAQYASL